MKRGAPSTFLLSKQRPSAAQHTVNRIRQLDAPAFRLGVVAVIWRVVRQKVFDRNHVEAPNHNTIIGGSFSTVLGNIIRDHQISKQASSCNSGRLKSTNIQTVNVIGSSSTRGVVSVFFLFFLSLFICWLHTGSLIRLLSVELMC